MWLVVDGKAHRQGITAGLNDGKKVEVLSGLSGTEEVINSGNVKEARKKFNELVELFGRTAR